MAAWLLASAWRGDMAWTSIVPEGLDDITLHGETYTCHVQAKSRQDPQSTFRTGEVIAYITKAFSGLPSPEGDGSDVRLAIVLERPIDSLEATGWETVLADVDHDEAVIRQVAEELRIPLVRARGLARRVHLIVDSNPLERGLAELNSEAGPSAADRLTIHALRDVAGRAADANATASAESRVALGRTDVQRERDAIHGAVDPLAYLELTSGLCEIADFATPVSEDAFREGVNVLPAHVGAGLVFERTAPMHQVLEALQTRAVSLVAGPSGAGKSAIAWLAAHATRHEVRWYRVRELQASDVAKLVRLSKLLDATTSRPIGFVVDDVGRSETSGWDVLVKELPAHPGMLAIATVREEDLFLLSTASQSVVVRPRLDEDLAARIWAAFERDGKSAFGFWREPFELSCGLLLEYIHLLSAGRRLEETIIEQVRRRLAEDRGDELMILQTVAFSSALGGAVDTARLRTQLGFDQPRFAKALRRLIDEHALRERSDGALTSLHEIRSKYLDEAVRDTLGTPRSDVVASAIDAQCADSVAALIVRLLRRWPKDDEPLLDALAKRMSEPLADVWIAIFHGLGLATVDVVAAKWLEVARALEIDDRHSGTIMMLALATGELSDVSIFAKAKAAKAAFEEVDVVDFRRRLAERLPEGLPPPSINLEQAHKLVAALVGVFGCKQPPVIPIHSLGDLSPAPLVPLLEMLRTLAVLDPAMADKAVDDAGGVRALLDRIYVETPWVTRPELIEEEGQLVVSADVRFIHPEVQNDLNGEVFRLCELMGAAAPRAQLVCAKALFPDGSLAGFGDFVIADKRVPRKNLTAPVSVAWNRAHLRALRRLVSAPDHTGRETALAGAVREFASKLTEAGDYFCRMKQPNAKWRLFLAVRAWLTDFIQPAAGEDAIGANPLERGGGSDFDNLHGLVTGLQRLIDELTAESPPEMILMAARTASLARDAAEACDPIRWRMTSKPPLEDLKLIEGALWDIRAVLGDFVKDPDRRRKIAARYGATSRRHNTLHRAADDSRRRADAALAEQKAGIRSAFADQGLDVEVVSCAVEKDDGWRWPNVDFAVLVKANGLMPFLTAETALRAAANAAPGKPAFEFAPLVNGFVLPMSMTFTSERLLPGVGLKPDWSDVLPYPMLEDVDHKLFSDGLDAVVTLSAAVQEPGREFNGPEQDFIERLSDRYGACIGELADKLEDTPHPALIAAAAFLAEMGKRVKAEFDKTSDLKPIAMEFIAAARGELNELNSQLILIRLALLERAVGVSTFLEAA